MKREDKKDIIDNLTEKIQDTVHFYLADTSELNAADTMELRRKCFENNIKLVVVKNTLLKKAFEKTERNFEELYDVLVGSTSIMFSEVGNKPARLIKEFRKEHKKPTLKAAFVEESIYIGEEHLEALTTIKSKEEVIGDVILLLQSPIKNVISSLKSGGQNLSGVIKTLSKKK